MSGGHSVIQNNCHYIFIYSFCATPLNYHGYNLKGFRQTFIWSQHTNVNLRVNYGCTEPCSLKEKMQMELGEWHPEMSEPGTKLWAYALFRSALATSHTQQLPHATTPWGSDTHRRAQYCCPTQSPNLPSKKDVRKARQSLLQMLPCLLLGCCAG